MMERILKLDVRDDLTRGREPFSRIMTTVAQLREDQSLLLIAPFEPKPLFAVLAKQGFVHEAKPLASGDWEVLFSRKRPSPTAGDPSQVEGDGAGAEACVVVDARGLEPPQPMVRILEALAELPEGMELRARTDRRPMHLYAQLAERGFVGHSEEQADGSIVTRIHRR